MIQAPAPPILATSVNKMYYEIDRKLLRGALGQFLWFLNKILIKILKKTAMGNIFSNSFIFEWSLSRKFTEICYGEHFVKLLNLIGLENSSPNSGISE